MFVHFTFTHIEVTFFTCLFLLLLLAASPRRLSDHCSAINPCDNITLSGVRLTKEGGGAGTFQCVHAPTVTFSEGSVPGVCS